MVKYMRGGVIRGTSTERGTFSTTNLPENTIWQDTDTANTYDLNAGSWRQRGGGGGGSPALFDKLKTFWVTKVGSNYFIYKKDGNVAQSGTDFSAVWQAQLDSMVSGERFNFHLDSLRYVLNNPILIPKSSSTSTLKAVGIYGWKPQVNSGAIEHGTQLTFSSTFPTGRHAIEADCFGFGVADSASQEHFILDIDGLGIDNRSFGRSWNSGAEDINILGGATVIDAGGIKIRQSMSTGTHGITVRNIHGMYLWRHLHLHGQVWFSTFENIATSDNSSSKFWTDNDPNQPINVKFVGDNIILLEALTVSTSSNPTVKGNHFCNIRRAGSGIYKNWLRMASGSYNTFVDVFPDGGVFKEAIFNLDNTDTATVPAHTMFQNQFYHLQTLDNGDYIGMPVPAPGTPVPSPWTDNRKGGALYLNGPGVGDNYFYGCMLTKYPANVKIAGGARNNYIQLSSYVGSNVLVDDMGAGDGNVVEIIGGFKGTPGLNEIESYSGIVNMLDVRSTPYELIGFTNVRKVGIDYCDRVNPAGFGLLSNTQQFGSPSLGSDVDGPFLSWAATANNNHGRTVSATTNDQPNFSRNRNPKLTARFQWPVANNNTQRLSIGWSSVVPTATTGGAVSDTILANTDFGVVFGRRTTDNNYQIFHNNGGGAMTVIPLDGTGGRPTIPIDTTIRMVQVWASESGTGTNNKWRVQVNGFDPVEIDSGLIPAASTVIYPHVCASRSTAGTFFRLRGWQVESK